MGLYVERGYTVAEAKSSGTWKLQAKVTLPSWNGRSAVAIFKVLTNLT